MSLDPSPLSPDPTPLLDPTDPAPGRGAALIGAIISVGLAIAVAIVSLRAGTQLLFFAIGLRAQASGTVDSSPYQIQGFDYYWTKSYGDTSSVGYTAIATADKIFGGEANDYHMNLAVITITADVDGVSATSIDYTSKSNADTYSDSVYTALAQQARQHKLTPVFRLALNDTNPPGNDPWPGLLGENWYSQSDSGTVQAEEQWIDSYTAFAVHYAQLAQTLNMPFFIVGSNLEYMTTDNNTKGRPATGDTFKCTGRRECEWRHVIAAVRDGTYHTYIGNKTISVSGFSGYTGQVIYEATGRINITNFYSNAFGSYEWDPANFLWWDAVDIIGIDAYFPLTNTNEPSVAQLEDAWRGSTVHGAQLAAPTQNGNLFQRLQSLFTRTHRPILFTSAGYESVSGSNQSPGRATILSDTASDQYEQLNDMEALLDTFSPQPWWLGVVWSPDYPVWPHQALSQTKPVTNGTLAEGDWTTNAEWAGDCLTGCSTPAKKAGVYLHQTYQIAPLPTSIPSTNFGT
jgi:hypothetical protein